VSGSRAALASQGQGESDDDQRRTPFPDELRDRDELAGRLTDVDGADGHGETPIVVGDRDPDPRVAEIESEDGPSDGDRLADGDRLSNGRSVLIP
jgi:hypothetical protein